MIRVNEQRSGAVDPTDPNKCALATMPMGTAPKFLAVIEGDSRDEIQDIAAKQAAVGLAAKHGFANGGLSNPPQIDAINGETGEALLPEQAFDPTFAAKVSHFRATFVFNGR